MDKVEMIKLKEFIKDDRFLPGSEIKIPGMYFNKIASVVFTLGEDYFHIEKSGVVKEEQHRIDLLDNCDFFKQDEEIIDFYKNLEVFDFKTKLKTFYGFEGFVTAIMVSINGYIYYYLENGMNNSGSGRGLWIRAEEIK